MLDDLGVMPENILFDDFVGCGNTKEPGLHLHFVEVITGKENEASSLWLI